MRTTGSIAALILLGAASVGDAAEPECRARVLRPVVDDLGNRWSVGRILPVTIQRTGPAGAAFCASGGSCLPASVAGREAVRLLDCRPGIATGGGDRRLVPMARGDAKARSAMEAVRSRLSALGFSNAAAATLADVRDRSPSSIVGRMVSRALTGSRRDLDALRRRYP